MTGFYIGNTPLRPLKRMRPFSGFSDFRNPQGACSINSTGSRPVFVNFRQFLAVSGSFADESWLNFVIIMTFPDQYVTQFQCKAVPG